MPRTQRLDSSSRELLENAASRPPSAGQYNLLKEEDPSHALARRQSVCIQVLGKPTKAEIAAIVRDVVSKQVGSDYYRNPMVEARWEGVNAHVVWVYIYQSPEDFKHRNHIAQAWWIDPDLSSDARPSMPETGENIGLSIKLLWNESYKALHDAHKSASVSKGSFLRLSDDIVRRAERIVQEVGTGLDDVDAASFGAFAKSQGHSRDALEDLYEEATDLGSAPFECQDLDLLIQGLAALWHNLTLFLARNGTWGDENALTMMRTTIRDFWRDHQKWLFEREKV